MTYSENGDSVTITMGHGEFGNLLFLLGYAAGAAHKQNHMTEFWCFMKLANSLNNGNPRYTPYEIPKERQ